MAITSDSAARKFSQEKLLTPQLSKEILAQHLCYRDTNANTCGTLRPDRSKVWDGPEPVTVEPGNLEALKKNPISLARLKFMIVRAEKLALEKAILSVDYLPKAEVQAGRVRRVHAAKGVLLGIPPRYWRKTLFPGRNSA